MLPTSLQVGCSSFRFLHDYAVWMHTIRQHQQSLKHHTNHQEVKAACTTLLKEYKGKSKVVVDGGKPCRNASIPVGILSVKPETVILCPKKRTVELSWSPAEFPWMATWGIVYYCGGNVTKDIAHAQKQEIAKSIRHFDVEAQIGTSVLREGVVYFEVWYK